MKPSASLKHVLPRRAAATARKLTTSATSTLGTASSSFLFDSAAGSPSSSGSSSHGAGPSSPRLLKPTVNPATPTTAITTYSPSSHPSGSQSLIAHPRYTTNSSHAYPGGGLPIIWFIPPSSSGKNEIERRLPWEGTSEGKGKERSSYTLEMGAYGIPKRRKTREEDHGESTAAVSHYGTAEVAATLPNRMTSSAAATKDDPSNYDLAVQVGEDAYFLRPDALGVADGVGGWRHKGESNSALFAKKLMHFCSWELAQAQTTTKSSAKKPPYPSPPASGGSTPTTAQPSSSATPLTSAHSTSSSSSAPTSGPDPIAILQRSYDRCVSEARESGMLGSSTATVAILADSELRIAHVGDCLACVVRDGEMVFRSEEMQHSFNYPYQLGPKSTTTPKDNAQRITVPVKVGDIVILASDGMGDNLWDEDVLDEINRFIRPSSNNAQATGPLSFAASTSTTSPSSSPSTTSPIRQAHTTAGPVTNTVLAQRLSEAIASRAKRVSGRRAITADATGTMGVFAPKDTSEPVEQPAPPAAAAVRPSTTPEKIQQPTPPPSPKVNPDPVVEGLELPKHAPTSIMQSDGQMDDVLGDGHGGDGEYGGSGYGFGWNDPHDMHEEEEEWVRDEIPFGRKAREAGVRFVGGKGDDITVLVAIISGAPEIPTERSNAEVPLDAMARLRMMNLSRSL